jgi:Integrase
MLDLQKDFIDLTRRNRENAFATRADRKQHLSWMGEKLGTTFRGLRLKNLTKRHCDALVEILKTEVSEKTGDRLSPGRQKNLLASFRWALKLAGKQGLLPDSNDKLQIQRRTYVTNVSKAQAELLPEAFQRLCELCPWTAASIGLTRYFGLRVEESIKIVPDVADRQSALSLKGAWTKGNVSRDVPILTTGQRQALDFAKDVAQGRALVKDLHTYKEQNNHARTVLGHFGICNIHGFRHLYAQDRYLELTGWEAPARGGPLKKTMTPRQIEHDKSARRLISRELGHKRLAVTNVYLGSTTFVERSESAVETDRFLA